MIKGKKGDHDNNKGTFAIFYSNTGPNEDLGAKVLIFLTVECMP